MEQAGIFCLAKDTGRFDIPRRLRSSAALAVS